MSKFAMRSKAVQLALVLTILTPLPLLAESPAPDTAKPSIASIVVLPAPATASAPTPVTAPGAQPTAAATQTTETQQTRAALPSPTTAAASQQPTQTAQLQSSVRPAKQRLATRHPRQPRVRSSQAISGSSITTQIARIMRRPEVQSLLVQYGAD
jgi:outer membrane biosynthesis protein TonB